LFLGSGLFDYQRFRTREKSLRIATATDVGGGTNYSMLRTMDEGYKVIALNGEKLNPFQSFWQITRGNAEALSVVENIGTLAEELFLLQTLGDDRAVREVYVSGKAAKSDLAG
jgi:guanine deaminase